MNRPEDEYGNEERPKMRGSHKRRRGSAAEQPNTEIDELRASGLEITNGGISKGSGELLPWAFIDGCPLEISWVGPNAPDDTTLKDHRGAFLTWVQKWLQAGANPVKGKSSNTSTENSLRKKFVSLAKTLRDTVTTAQKRKDAKEMECLAPP